jgi:ABC-type transport system involved in cytochrome c biogenesis permease subunit
MPTTSQIIHLGFAILLFGVGTVFSISRLWRDGDAARIGAKACSWTGVLLAVVVLVWHAVARGAGGGNWLPLEDNFEAFVWLGILLAVFVLYVQRAKALGGLDWFVMPIVIVLLVAAIVFGRANPQPYADTTWSWVHRITAYGGALAFAIAGAAGAMYLLASRRLRHKTPAQGPRQGSLERLEHLTFTAVTLGFAMMTCGLVAGLVWQLRLERAGGGPTRLGEHWYASPKVLMASAVWVVYAVVLHARINPVFRGRKVAILSIVGCVLMVGTLITLNLMPEGTR